MARSSAPTPPPPPPSNSDSCAPAFKSNASRPGLGATEAPAAAAPPPLRVPSDALVTVLSVVGDLRARGFLSGLEIPAAELTDTRAPYLFDTAVTAFYDKVIGPAARAYLPIPPPPPLEDGRRVELLRLFLAVRSRGGFAAVASWAAVAEAVGLDADAKSAEAVNVLYRRYLDMLYPTSYKQRKELEAAGSSGNGGRRMGSAILPSPKPSKGPTGAGSAHPKKKSAAAGSAHLKRKRAPLVGMLNWVRLVAKSPAEPRVRLDPQGHFSTAVALRDQMLAEKLLTGEKLEAMLSSLRLVAKNPAAEAGVIGEDPDHPVYIALLLRSKMFANIDCSNGSASRLQSGHSNEGALRSIDRLFAAPIRPRGKADIPEWTGKPPSGQHDRRALKFLGEPILFPESNEALDAGSIGKGRQDFCNCQFPGSIDCIRFHVAEKKDELKRELGSSFCKMGFDRTGEDAALTWTNRQERKFNSIIQGNLPSSRYNFWGKLRAGLSEDSKSIVSYYHNVFQVRRRAYQNHLALNADSDDDSIEPGFLGSLQGDGNSSSRSAASSKNQKSS